MKLKTTFGLTIILAILYSCSSPKMDNKTDKVVIEERIALPHTKSEKLFNDLRPESQKFQITADSDNIITGKGGTQVFIPKNSFINAKGELVTGMVDIEIIEVLSVADFIKTNLQTVSNKRPLQSEGMVFIDAQYNGLQLELAKKKKIQIELPKLQGSNTASDIRIFSGIYDSLHYVNWTEISDPEKKLIPLPMDLFDFTFRKSHKFKLADNSNGFDISELAKLDKTTLNNRKFENTIIATREFEERFYTIWSAGHLMGQWNSFYSKIANSGIMKFDYTILNFYINNADRDLAYCDSLALSSFKEWKRHADSVMLKYQTIDMGNVLNNFQKYYDEALGTVYDFTETYNLKGKNLRVNLTMKGLDEEEIDEIIGAYERQEKIITARRNKEKAQYLSTNSFSTAKLGWINCDQFYNEPTAKEVNILASVNNIENFEFVTLTLVINGRRIALGGTQTDNLKYTFTGKSQPYTRLPIGEKATIIGLSYKEDKPYLGIKEIVISEKSSYSIDLESTTVKEINDKLNGIQ